VPILRGSRPYLTGALSWLLQGSPFVFFYAAFYYSAPVGVRSIVINPSICLMCVCLSVREHISGTAGPIGTKFCIQTPVAVARSSSGGVALRCVLPVLWMTLRLAVMGATPARAGSTQSWRLITCATGAESDVYECSLLYCNIVSRA